MSWGLTFACLSWQLNLGGSLKAIIKGLGVTGTVQQCGKQLHHIKIQQQDLMQHMHKSDIQLIRSAGNMKTNITVK